MRAGLERIGRERFYNSNKFEKAKGVILWEVLKIQHEQEFNLRIISTNSKYRQGIRLAIDAGEGYIEINDIKAKELYLWEDTIPEVAHVKCVSDLGLLSIYNVYYVESDMGLTGVLSQLDSSGMLLEHSENVYVYRCNDEGFKDEFNKLVFEIEIL